jgi:hypothetical protein
MEGAMNATNTHDNIGKNPRRPVTSLLHPQIYVAVIGLAAWFALAVWGFAAAGFVDYLLFVVSGFICAVVALTLILSRVGTHSAADGASAKGSDNPPSFHDWAAGDFDTSQERLTGAQAATLILLPLASAAVGMTAFVIAFHIAEHSM